MDMISNSAAGINSYMMKTYLPPGIFPRYHVPEKDTGKLRVRVPWEGFYREFLPVPDDRSMPAGWLLRFHGVHIISNFVESM
jgi:hypothetical protein